MTDSQKDILLCQAEERIREAKLEIKSDNLAYYKFYGLEESSQDNKLDTDQSQNR